jgi:transcriptional regulator with XRE-family HTH domain
VDDLALDDLGTVLRSWRDRLQPAEVGLRSHGRRRAAGLRREELAALAGLSVDYVVRLEQGRARHPSVQVVAALARALQLSDTESAHLHRLAGAAPPAAGTVPTALSPGVLRLMNRLGDVPIGVFSADMTLLQANELWQALMPDLLPGQGRDSNVAWRHFTGQHSTIIRTASGAAEFARGLVGDLRKASGHYPDDEALRQLVADLHAVSPLFATHWDRGDVLDHLSSRKTFDHPTVGLITLDCDVLHVPSADLRIIAYTPVPGSPDASALALLTVGAVCALQR